MVVDVADAQWPHLERTVSRSLRDMEEVVAGQPITSTWTADAATRAHQLIRQLDADWAAHRIRPETFMQLEQLSGRMTVAGCTVMRANLEALREQLRLLLHDTASALNPPAGVGAGGGLYDRPSDR